MKPLILRLVVPTGDGSVPAFVPGLTVEADAAATEQILKCQAGFAAEPTCRIAGDYVSSSHRDDRLARSVRQERLRGVDAGGKASPPACAPDP